MCITRMPKNDAAYYQDVFIKNIYIKNTNMVEEKCLIQKCHHIDELLAERGMKQYWLHKVFPQL